MCSPNDSFYNASAESHVQTTVFNVVWRTHVLQMIFFLMPARGRIQTEQFLIRFGERVLQMVVFIMPSGGRILNGTLLNMVWRTRARAKNF